MATCWSQGSQSRRHGRSHSRRRSRRCRRRQLRFRYLEDQRQLLRRGCTEVGDNGAPCGVRERFRRQAHAAIWGPSEEGRVRHLRPSNSPSAGATHILFHNRICSWSLRACWRAIQAESARTRNLHARLCSPQTAPVLRSPTGSSTAQLGYIAALCTQVSGREGAPYHEAGCSRVCSRGALRLRGGRSWHGGGWRECRSAVAGSPLDQELCCLPAKPRTSLTHHPLPVSMQISFRGSMPGVLQRLPPDQEVCFLPACTPAFHLRQRLPAHPIYQIWGEQGRTPCSCNESLKHPKPEAVGAILVRMVLTSARQKEGSAHLVSVAASPKVLGGLREESLLAAVR